MGLSLDALRARVHAPEGGREDLDTLLEAIDRPLGLGESARHRAEQLKRIVADSWLAEYTGSDGRRANEAAAQALRILGEHFASELSEEPRAGAGRTPPEPSTRLFAHHEEPEAATSTGGFSWRDIAAVLAIGVGLYEGYVVLGSFASMGFLFALVVSGATLILPALVLMSRPEAHRRAYFILSAILAALAVPFVVLLPMAMVAIRKLYMNAQDGESTVALALLCALVRMVLVVGLLSAPFPRRTEPS